MLLSSEHIQTISGMTVTKTVSMSCPSDVLIPDPRQTHHSQRELQHLLPPVSKYTIIYNIAGPITVLYFFTFT